MRNNPDWLELLYRSGVRQSETTKPQLVHRTAEAILATFGTSCNSTAFPTPAWAASNPCAGFRPCWQFVDDVCLICQLDEGQNILGMSPIFDLVKT